MVGTGLAWLICWETSGNGALTNWIRHKLIQNTTLEIQVPGYCVGVPACTTSVFNDALCDGHASQMVPKTNLAFESFAACVVAAGSPATTPARLVASDKAAIPLAGHAARACAQWTYTTPRRSCSDAACSVVSFSLISLVMHIYSS